MCATAGDGGKLGHRRLKSSSAASTEAWFSPLRWTPGSELSASKMVVEPLLPVPITNTCLRAQRSQLCGERLAPHTSQSHQLGSHAPAPAVCDSGRCGSGLGHLCAQCLGCGRASPNVHGALDRGCVRVFGRAVAYLADGERGQ